MTIKANAAYDEAGFKTTKELVTSVRQHLGRFEPDSLKGEPWSLRPDAIRPESSVQSSGSVRRGSSRKK